ncbi:NAD(P)-binding domain-containing protein [Kosakonia sp. H02]|nr:NAD(P)-binding domain-containing protein [Kosakonia sp. H02]
MAKIGILDVDALTETLLRGLLHAIPDLEVFISPGHCERAQTLAREFPCWTMDTNQEVVDEADIIIISVAADTLDNLAESVQLRSSQTLISLIPGIQIQTLREKFKHSQCVSLCGT